MKLIVTIIIIYLVFRVLTTYVFPWLVKRYIERAKKKFYSDNPQFREKQEKKKGDMTITYKEEQDQPDTDKLGEYTDFEDIKED
ncbi:MAG: hypothetical protein RBS53_11830 [Bacteroidales bacterium]|jgi:hypothetical protein|nr:hypothetical protein [Bacteroidales bacterium]NLM93883.1 hypothetical protein [Bacteroidales bacterium]